MDLNWNGADGRTFRLGIPESVAYPGDKARKLRELIDFYEGMVFCGGNWDIRDWMHFQLGGNTWNNPKTGDFVKRKIRADGYSTFRRGAVPPSDPDAGGGRPLPRDGRPPVVGPLPPATPGRLRVAESLRVHHRRPDRHVVRADRA